MMGNLSVFLSHHLIELQHQTVVHLMLTSVSTGLAVAMGVPLGLLVLRYKPLRGLVLGMTAILQTIPSLAMLAFLLPLLGIGAKPALVALTLYALLPIVQNTYVGLSTISPSILEAADGIGFTRLQRMKMVEIPLALPVIIAGIRTAAVIGVGIATLSAFIGAGGLGDFINRGLAMDNTSLVLLGAIPAAILALLINSSIALVEEWLRPGRKTTSLRNRTWAFASAMLALVGGIAWASRSTGASRATGSSHSAVIRIGTKNFTEQIILGEMMAQLIEAHTDFQVVRKFDLGGTIICHQALIRGEIDLYPEYTGTALTAILHHPPISNPDQVYSIVQAAYERKFQCEWLPPFGFDNTYVLAARQSEADTYGWHTISDLRQAAPHLRAGFTAEFRVRPDGYPGLRRAYGFGFGQVMDLEPSLMYQALANGKVDIISAYSTDGRIAAYHLVTLKDNRHFFPPYYAAPVVRMALLKAHPSIRKVLAPLAGAINDATMRHLNFEVDVLKRSPREVARKFLESRGLTP